MKKGLTEMVFILDQSGSMQPLTDDTVGGFNAMLQKQKEEEGECVVTTVLFNEKRVLLHDRLPIEKVKPMESEDYRAYGMTALLDALGETLQRIASIQKHIREEDRPERTVFVITTDGKENASRQFRKEEVKELVGESQKENGWEFLFIGANIDAFECAEGLGISRERASNYIPDSKGSEILYRTVSDTMTSYRRIGSINADWSRSIDSDFRKRHPRRTPPTEDKKE